ncbi:MAG: hypothetical protein ACRELS_12895 [Candidatus Rokuibacteriota bacterium]
MTREIFIVARNCPEIYRYLTQTFAGAENVQVIWDRREVERRGAAGRRSAERRRADRRQRAAIDAELKAYGYAFLSVD